MASQFVSAKEAIEILQIPAPTFYRFVKNGKIKKYFPNPLKVHGEYAREEIAHLKSQFRKTSELSEPIEKGETDWIKNSDIGNMYDLEYNAYGDDTGNPAIIRKWYARNPQICRVLFNKNDRRDFWGAINLLPLREETIYKLLREEIKDIDLNPKRDILTFEETGVYNFYVASVIVRPEKKLFFSSLFNSVFNFWCEMAPERTIGKIYGRVVTDDGEMMAKKLYFSPLTNISDSAFMLDVTRPNPSRIVQSFQYCVNSSIVEKQKKNLATKL